MPQLGQKNKSAYLFTSSRGETTASKIKSAYLFTALEGSKSTPKLKSAYLFTTLKSEKNTNFRKVRKMNKKTSVLFASGVQVGANETKQFVFHHFCSPPLVGFFQYELFFVIFPILKTHFG